MYLLSAEGPRAALQLLSDKVRHARSFLGNAHVGAEHNYSDPRSQRTGVALTLNTAPEKVLGLSEEMQPTSIYRYVLTLSLFIFIHFGIATLRITEQGILVALNTLERVRRIIRRTRAAKTLHLQL